MALMARNLDRRHGRGIAWRIVFNLSTLVGIVALCALLFNILNESFGLVALTYDVEPSSVLPAGKQASDLDVSELVTILKANVSGGLYRKWEAERPLGERPQPPGDRVA
jgi:hypothetical protein